MKETKTQKGITLIALIITIVVLLILAGVAIGTLDQTNIIGRAKEAAAEYEKGKKDENTLLNDFESLLEIAPTTKVYGTKEFYIIDSQEGLCGYANGEGGMLKKKTKEDVINTLTDDMKSDMEELENLKKSKIKYFIFGTDDSIIGVIFENDTIYLGETTLTYNESLTAELGKNKEDFTCYKMELMGVETILAIDHSAKQYTAVAIGGEDPEGPKTISYEERRVEEAKTITVYGVSGQETVDIDESMTYIFCDAAEGDDVICIEFEDYLLYTTSLEGENVSAMKYTKAAEKDILKLGIYYK